MKMELHRFRDSAARCRRALGHRTLITVPATLLLAATGLYAQADPWDNAVQVLQTAFTGPIARGLALVAIVVGGLMFAFGEGQSKRMLAGIVFGLSKTAVREVAVSGRLVVEDGRHPDQDKIVTEYCTLVSRQDSSA